MTHGLAVLYARWNQKDGDVAKTEAGLAGNVQKDLAFFQAELEKGKGKFFFGDKVTAADIMMEFSLDFILARELGSKAQDWPKVKEYIQACQSTASWQKAQKKTGHKL